MNDLYFIRYKPSLMLIDMMSMPGEVELAHRRLCDFIWALDELPSKENEFLWQHCKVAQSSWGRVKQGLFKKGWFEAGDFFTHRGAVKSLNDAKEDYVSNCNQTAKARKAPLLACVPDPVTGIFRIVVTNGVATPVTGPVTPPVTHPQSERESESESGERGNAPAPDGKTGGTGGTSNIQAGKPPHESRITHHEPDPIAHGAVELPDEKTALSQADTRAIPADFARLCYADWFGNNGCDAGNKPKAWLTYVDKRWRYEQEDWKSGKHRGKKSGARSQESGGPKLAEVVAYAKEKGDEHGAFAVSFHRYWEGKGWKRENGTRIDWKVAFQNNFAKHREGKTG